MLDNTVLARLSSRTTARVYPAPRIPEKPLALPWWVHASVILAVCLIVYRVATGMWGWTYDDVYIIYRYARNFAGGMGMVYNPGQAYLGTSSPGYTLLLAAMHALHRGSTSRPWGALSVRSACSLRAASYGSLACRLALRWPGRSERL